MKKIKLLLLLLLIFIYCTSAYAEKSAIHSNGFRDMTWGQSLEDISDQNILLVALDFDTNKKLFNYIRKNEQYNIYNTRFDSIYYHMWSNKFVAARAAFNAERDAKAFQRIYDGLVSDFGIGKQVYQSNNPENEQTLWQNGNTFITLSYNNRDKSGSLYIYNPALQKEYLAFLKNLPNSPPDYKNQPTGFAGMKWRESISNLKANSVRLIANKSANILGDYTIADAEKTFMDIPVTKITYGFWENQLWSAYIYYKNQDFGKLYQKLNDHYGMPANGRFDASSNTHYYVWPGETTYIIIYQFLHQKESYVFFASKELYDLQEKTRQVKQ